MKKRVPISLGVVLAAGSLTLSSLAERPPGPGRPPGGGFSGGGTAQAQPPKPRGMVQELGKAGDRFVAWRVAYLEGAEWFTKEQEELRESYREVERKIREAVAEDRLEEKKGREFLVTLVKIGKDAGAGDKATETSLENLDDAVQQETEDKAKAETLTPRLNKIQWLISEVLYYGTTSSTLSNGKMSSLNRKLLSNEEKEDKAKEDGELSERELEKLEEDALEIWETLIKAYRGRDE